MLVLSRRANESIMIGDDIEVTVVAIGGNQVHLGVKAPKAIPIFRRELYARLMEGTESALEESEAKVNRQ